MTFARKLELVCSVVLTLLEVVLAFFFFYHADKKSASSDETHFFLLVTALFYALPVSLIISGSYFHIVKRKFAGMVILIIGCSLTVIIFFLWIYLIAILGGLANLWGKLYLLALVMAIITIIISLVVERQHKKAISSS
jgi:hypothetical protein